MGFFIICGFLVVFPIYDTPQIVAIDVLVLIVGVIVYFVFIRWKNKPTLLKKILSKLSIFSVSSILHMSLSDSFDVAVQKLFVAVKEE